MTKYFWPFYLRVLWSLGNKAIWIGLDKRLQLNQKSPIQFQDQTQLNRLIQWTSFTMPRCKEATNGVATANVSQRSHLTCFLSKMAMYGIQFWQPNPNVNLRLGTRLLFVIAADILQSTDLQMCKVKSSWDYT